MTAERSHRIRVFMVDDSTASCLAVRRLLSTGTRIDLDFCTDPAGALDALREARPDLLLLDVDMPAVDGLEVLRRVRCSSDLCNLPVLMYSGRTEEAIRARSLALGANDFIAKREDRLELIARIEYHADAAARRARGVGPDVTLYAASTHAVKVLMIDPSRAACLAMERMLDGESDIEFVARQDLAEALGMAEDFLPTVILLSMTASAGDGVDAVAILRDHPATRGVPILVLTASEETRLQARALAAGASDFLVKSRRRIEIIGRIRAHSSTYHNARVLPTRALEAEDMVREPIGALIVDRTGLARRLLEPLLASETNIALVDGGRPTDPSPADGTLRPSIVLYHVDREDPTALEAIPGLREDVRIRGVPIVVVGELTPAGKARAFGLGADDCVDPGIDKIELVSRIHHHARAFLNARRLDRTLQQLVDDARRHEARSLMTRKTFSRYLSEEIVDRILESGEGTRLGGEKRVVTILMSDLRGFTSMSETMDPQVLLSILNEYLTAMTDVIFAHGGTIDEFIGDAILALFGAPIERKDDAARAIACALEMQKAMDGVNRSLTGRNLPALEMAIAVNTGEVLVGNIGSVRRSKYGVAGRNVNRTARIESFACGGQVLVSQETVRKARPVEVRVRGAMMIEMKGLTDALVVHDVFGIGPPHDVELIAPDEADPVELSEPLDVIASQIVAKSVSQVIHRGRIVSVTDRGAVFETGSAFAPFDDLQLRLTPSGEETGGRIFAKVLEVTPGDPSRHHVRFTHVDPAALERIERRIADPALAASFDSTFQPGEGG